MLFRITKTIEESPSGSGFYRCLVLAIPLEEETNAALQRDEHCIVSSRPIAEAITKHLERALVASIIADGHDVERK